MYWEYFVPVYALPIHFLNGLFWWAKILNFDEVKFIKFFSCVFCIPWKKSLFISNNKDISQYFLLKVSELAFMFRSMTHLKFFVYTVKQQLGLFFSYIEYLIVLVPVLEDFPYWTALTLSLKKKKDYICMSVSGSISFH